MATEAPNTLRSRAKYRIVDIISEGPIVGLAEGLQSIYLNGTPIEANGGGRNFKTFMEDTDLRVLPRPVYPNSQPNQYGLISSGTVSEATETVNAKVTKDSPEGSGSGDGSVIRTITDSDIDELRVTIRIPALFVQNTTTGDSSGSSLDFRISVAPDGGAFVPISTSSQWVAWSTAETQNDATGFSVKARLWVDILDRLKAKSAVFQYAKKTGETWGAWVTFKTVAYPGQSPSSDKNSYWNNQNYFTTGYRDVEAKVANLEPGTYKIQIVATNVAPSITSKQQFVPAFSTITGKCVAPYDASYIVPLPAGGAPWTVKIERLTNDNVASNYQDDLYWLSYTELIYEKFAWSNLAGLELILNADDFDSIPERAYDVFGLMISIPSNYDPYNRTYSGIWDGTFQTNWTDNPAWILYDLIKNKRYGLGDNIPESYLETLKWSLYSIAQYCDENVTIADEISEPRYTCSCVINSQQEAYDLLNTIVSTFRGMLYPVGEGLMAVADRLTDPVINVGPANVIDGMFVYRGPARKTIHTAAYVTWNNPDDGYKLNTALYENQEGIARYGYKIDKINAVGACSKSLAIRLAKWKILTEVMAPDTVTYRASFDHLNVMPGDIINVSDPAYTSEELIGRILSITDNEDSTHTVELDRSVARIGGDESILQLTLPDQKILSIDVSVVSTTTGTEIIVPSAELTTMPVTGAMWLLSKETVRPRMWRVFNIEEAEKNIYEVSASLVDPEKWDEIEGTHNFEPADYTAFPSGELPPPTGLTHSEFLKQSGNSIVCCVNLSWTAPDDARAAYYRAEYRKGTEPWKSTEPVLCQNPSIDVFDIEPGTYDFRVQAQDATGLMKSDWTYRTSQTLYGKQKAPENVTGFSGTVEKFGILLKWTPVSDIDIDFYEVRTGATWAGSAATAKKAKASELKIEDATTGTHQFWIAAKDTSGNYSTTPVTTSVTVSAQGIPTVTSTSVTSGIQITIGGTTTRGFKAYEVQRRAYPAGTATTINNNVLTTIFKDSDIATLGYTTQWQYRVRALDQNDSASGWSEWSTQRTAKQIESVDITANQIIAKDFRTACNAGCSTGSVVAGVLFNASGLEAWNATTRTFHINALTGDVCMTGTITATAGLIGGFTVDPLEGLHAGCTTTRVQMKPGAGFWAGATAQVDAPFSVTQVGYLKSTSGLIGNWKIEANKISRCTTDGSIFWIGNSSAGGNQAQIYIGTCSGSNGISIGENPFVGSYGTNKIGINIRSNSTNIFTVCSDCSGGNLLAQIAGWNFNATQLYSTSCGLILNAAGSIQTGDFVTSNKGWKIDSVGNAEFNNICARGAIRTAVFIKDEISVVGGCTMIRPASVLTCDDNYSASSNVYYVDDNTQFAVNDLIRIKNGAGDFWGKVTASTTGCITVAYCNGNTSGEITKGQAIVNYGSCVGCGGIMLNGQCPYIDLYTHAGLPWCGLDSRVRIGNLKGWGTFATNTYGIAIGATTETNRLTYDTASGKLKIYGDIEVMSSGNILPDPDFKAIPYAADYTVITTCNQTQIGEYMADVVGQGTVYATHRLSTSGRTVYMKQCSNSFWLRADNNASYARVVSTNLIPVQCNATYTLSVYAAKQSGLADPRVYIGLCYYDISGNAIGYDYPVASACLLSSTTPIRLSGSKVMPSNAAYVKLHFVNYQPSSDSRVYLSGAQLELGSLTSWKCNQGGTITADMVKTGVLSSLNWGSTTGSCISMNDGTFKFGGESAPKLSWNGTTLNVVGNITIAAGSSGIANFTDANIDNIADGTTYKRTTQNEKTGASRAYSGLDSSNRLITAVIPGTAVTPSTAGLFIGSTNMGYHNGTVWKTYMDNTGNFYLGGSAAGCGLAWNATTNCLTVCGCITSCAGTIGGWNIEATRISSPNCTITIGTNCNNNGCGISIISNGTSKYFIAQLMANCIYTADGFICHSGLVIRSGANGCYLFRATSCATTNAGDCAFIAGWNFNANCLYSNNILINNNGSIYSNNYAAGSAGWCINGAGAAEFSDVTVRGTVCACGGGNIGGFVIGTNMLCSTPAAGCSVGMSSCTTSGAIAFWAGCSDVASAPFRVTNTGALTALCGQIGCFTLTGGCLFASVAAQDCAAVRMSQGYYCNSLGPGYGEVARDVPSTCRDRLWSTPSSLIMSSWSCATAQYRCACITMCSACNGNVPASAPIMVCMLGGALCYAMCVSGSIYATGGTVCTSDRNLKTDFQDVNVLYLLRQMPVTKWRFKDGKDYKIGPMAQDFNNLFRLNHDWQTNLTVSGLDGIALKAVKEVDENVQKHDREIAGLRAKIAVLESSLAELKEAIAVH